MENTGSLVCSRCKFTDCKGQRYFFLSWISLPAKSVFVYVIVTDHINLHRENLQSDGMNRENTKNLKMQFEWVPCFSRIIRPKKKNSCVQVSLSTLILGPTLKMLNFF